MKLSSIPGILALLMVCIFALAAPTSDGHTPNLTDVSSHHADGPAENSNPNVTTVSSGDTLNAQWGINCKGSGFCHYCPPDGLAQITAMIDTIPDGKSYGQGVQIACFRCGASQGLCAFTQNRSGRLILGFAVKLRMKDLMNNGCKRCGSAPTDNGNVWDGELIVNYCSSFCGHRVCPGQGFAVSQADLDAARVDPVEDNGLNLESSVSPRDIVDLANLESSVSPRDTVDLAKPVEEYKPNLAGVSYSDVVDKFMGINCKGSGLCNDCGDIYQINDYIQGIPDDKWYREGQSIACHVCGGVGQGLCAFTQYRNGRDIPGWRVKQLVPDLIRNSCRHCGSAPTDTDNCYDGELTVNYVHKTACEGICKEVVYVSEEDRNSELVDTN